jgi:hypothetical protein
MQKFLQYERDISEKIRHYVRPDPPDLLLDGFVVNDPQRSGGLIRVFPQSTLFFMVLHPHIIWGMNNRPVGGHSSET